MQKSPLAPFCRPRKALPNLFAGNPGPETISRDFRQIRERQANEAAQRAVHGADNEACVA